MALVLETLGGDQPLDAGSLGVGGLALALGLDLSSDNVLADLGSPATLVSFILEYCIQLAPLSSPPLPFQRRGRQGQGSSHTLPGLPAPPLQLRAGDDRVWA